MQGGRAQQLQTPACWCSQPQPGTDARGGCRCISGRAPFSAPFAGRPACALPAGGLGLARRARPSLRQWVWIWVGEEGEGKLCLLPLTPLVFFPLRTRGAIFLRRVLSLLYHSKPVAELQRTGRGLSLKCGRWGEEGGNQRRNFGVLLLRACWGVHPGSSSGARRFVCRDYVVCVASRGFLAFIL